MTILHHNEEEVNSQNLWDGTAQIPSESTITNNKVGTTQIQATTDQEWLLILSTTHGRLDWIFSAPPEQAAQGNMGTIQEVLKEVMPLFQRGLAQDLSISRLALGIVLRHPVASRAEGYHKIQTFLDSVRLDPEGSQDFFYQINRPRAPSTNIGRKEVNRLLKWTVGSYFQAKISQFDTEVSLPITQFCRLELDINTEPVSSTHEPIPTQSLHPLLEELRDLSIEITSKGDIP